MKKDSRKLVGLGLLGAMASSLCCTIPLIAAIAGGTGLVANVSWLETYRPYLIGFSLVMLGFAWYQELRPARAPACACNTPEKKSFFRSRAFLGMMTAFALLMGAFPYLRASKAPAPRVVVVHQEALRSADVHIEGMTCTSCENHVMEAINGLDGIVAVQASYRDGLAHVSFDTTRTSLQEIENAITQSGYSVVH